MLAQACAMIPCDEKFVGTFDQCRQVFMGFRVQATNGLQCMVYAVLIQFPGELPVVFKKLTVFIPSAEEQRRRYT